MKNLIVLLIVLFFSAKSEAQMDHSKMKNKVDTVLQTKYTCTMHPEVELDKPGKCPKCGMTLVKKEVKKEMNKKYTCQMHPEVISNKPGKCPKCGMELIEKQIKPKDDEMKEM